MGLSRTIEKKILRISSQGTMREEQIISAINKINSIARRLKESY